jgi:phosphoribosylanthranilate isomerase
VTLVKICGVTLADDAAAVSAAGADYIGLNFWRRSKRYLAPERAPIVASCARLAGAAKLVGVFVDADVDDVLAIARVVELDAVQLHGDDSPDGVAAIAKATALPVWKAIQVAQPRDIDNLQVWPVEAIVLDAATAGAGKGFDHAIAREARRKHPTRKLVLAGGLDPGNVAAGIAAVEPWCVDVATGVEAAPGVKDAAKVAAFVAAVRDVSTR